MKLIRNALNAGIKAMTGKQKIPVKLVFVRNRNKRSTY